MYMRDILVDQSLQRLGTHAFQWMIVPLYVYWYFGDVRMIEVSSGSIKLDQR